jgi:D-alanine-D-alanine ligase
MNTKKIKIGVIFGGKSAEHEVSINSAKNIINSLSKEKYEIIPVKIGKDGKIPFNKLMKLDVAFPIIHGPFGEDGSLQGVLKMLNIPFVGPSVLGSAVGMDKDVMKRLLNEVGIKNAKGMVLKYNEKLTFEKAKATLGLPMFVKPANLGSSVGVSKVQNKKDFTLALSEAFKYDSKILIEEMILGRELECAVLGNERPVASPIGEVIMNTSAFYSYDAKYIEADGAITEIPAKNLSKSDIKKLQDTAIKVFQTLCCEGLSRVDMFLTKKGEIYVNEINTLPGFTDISMYPKLFELKGMNKTELIDKLVLLAIERFEKENQLQTSVS